MDKKENTSRNDFVAPATIASIISAIILGLIVALLTDSREYGIFMFAATIVLAIIAGILTMSYIKLITVIRSKRDKQKEADSR